MTIGNSVTRGLKMMMAAMFFSALPAVGQILPHQTFMDGVSQSRFGQVVASAGDVNNDGLDDIIVGAPFAKKVFVYSGSDGSLIYSLSGIQNGRFGAAVCGIGDYNGDGFDDFMVGDPLWDAGSSCLNCGRVEIYSGASGTSVHAYTGSASGDQLGASVAGLGDIDGDGVLDLAIGIPRADAIGFDSGRVQVILGPPGNFGTTINLFGSALGARFGERVASAGDYNGDGAPDVAIAAPGAAGGGTVSIYSFFPSFMQLATLQGQVNGDNFGYGLCSAGDVNQDGFDDLLVTTPFEDTAGANAGSARVFSGFDNSILHEIFGGMATDNFGFSCSGGGDFNGDGFADFIVGAVGQDGAGTTDVGTAQVFSGRTGVRLARMFGSNKDDHLGESVNFLSDLNGDGLDDFVVGVPDHDQLGNNAGLVHTVLAPIPQARSYFSLTSASSFDLNWLPDNNDIFDSDGSLHGSGASPFGVGVFGVSFALDNFDTAFGFPILIGVDPLSLFLNGSFQYDANGEFLAPNLTRQHPLVAGQFVFIQWFEFSPVVRGSNGIQLLMVP